MSEAFCSLPYADKKYIIDRYTILVKELDR